LRKAVAAALLKQATAEGASGPEEAGRAWVRSQAICGLGLLGSVGDNNGVFNAILKSVGDAGLSFSGRCVAATSLGRLDYSGAEGIDLDGATTILASFLVETCADDEVPLAKMNERKAFRRRLKECLHAVSVALTGDGAGRKGIASLAKEKQVAHLGELAKSLKVMLEGKLDDKNLDEDDLRAAIQAFRDDVQGWSKKAAPSEPEK
jgi:hypothetical protein